MDFKSFSYFIAIAEQGSMSAAAQQLHISQPTLSYQLSALEHELGGPLLTRGNRARRVQLTDAGNAFYRRAKDIMALVDVAHGEARDILRGDRYTVRIGIDAFPSIRLLGHTMAHCHEVHPHVFYDFNAYTNREALSQVHDDLCDLAFLSMPFPTQGLSCLYMQPHPMLVVGHERFLPFSGPSISPEQLRGLPLILSHYTHPRLIECCKPYGFSPQLLCYMSKIRARLIWACEGIGVSLVPYNAVEQSFAVIPPHVRTLVLDEPRLTTQTALVHKKDAYLHASVRFFLDTFTSLYEQKYQFPLSPTL